MADDKQCPFCKKKDALIRLRVAGGDSDLIAFYPLKGPQGVVYLWVCQYCGKNVVRKQTDETL